MENTIKKSLNPFDKEDEIKRELTTPYNPQHNVIAKRKNMTIMEVVKTMIHDQDLPMHLCVEATRMKFYVHNILSHSSLGFKTPKEMFIGKNPELSHLKIVGSIVYVHISKEKRTKLDPSEKREYLLDTVKSPKPLKYTFQDSITGILVGM